MSSRAVQTGVVTDYLYLGLHEACAKGNVGLAKYALTHGQPVNSVLVGILPLHAACASGTEAVVKLLLEYGADPNSVSQRTTGGNTSGIIIGTTGSTPLHFASANGHTHIVRLLLSHGARADRADARGVAPLQLARHHGHEDVARTLEEWLAAHPPPECFPAQYTSHRSVGPPLGPGARSARRLGARNAGHETPHAGGAGCSKATHVLSTVNRPDRNDHARATVTKLGIREGRRRTSVNGNIRRPTHRVRLPVHECAEGQDEVGGTPGPAHPDRLFCGCTPN